MSPILSAFFSSFWFSLFLFICNFSIVFFILFLAPFGSSSLLFSIVIYYIPPLILSSSFKCHFAIYSFIQESLYFYLWHIVVRFSSSFLSIIHFCTIFALSWLYPMNYFHQSRFEILFFHESLYSFTSPLLFPHFFFYLFHSILASFRICQLSPKVYVFLLSF